MVSEVNIDMFMNIRYHIDIEFGQVVAVDTLTLSLPRVKQNLQVVKGLTENLTPVINLPIENNYNPCSHPLFLRTFAPKSSYGEIFFISSLELVHKVLSPKMKKKKMGVSDFVLEKMAVEKCLNFNKSVIITTCSLLC